MSLDANIELLSVHDARTPRLLIYGYLRECIIADIKCYYETVAKYLNIFDQITFSFNANEEKILEENIKHVWFRFKVKRDDNNNLSVSFAIHNFNKLDKCCMVLGSIQVNKMYIIQASFSNYNQMIRNNVDTKISSNNPNQTVRFTCITDVINTNKLTDPVATKQVHLICNANIANIFYANKEDTFKVSLVNKKYLMMTYNGESENITIDDISTTINNFADMFFSLPLTLKSGIETVIGCAYIALNISKPFEMYCKYKYI